MSIDLDKDMMNEETIKNKVILPLLLNKNDININNLSFEESFSIVIGRSKIDINKLSEIEKKKRPRYDILVSDKLQNKNLFIIEVKRDRLDLTDEDRDQAISYARLTHPITPIAITTNGKNNRVYNTITKEEIDKINIDNINYDISLDSENYYEAIKKLITFNEGCFKSFLENEYIENTQQLIAKDKEEEKAYFPKLFVENEELENEFGLFMRCNERAFSLIAQSGMGKSCWMCYKAKELIEGGSFVYFLRSIDIENDIISTITNNLNWGKGIPDFRTPKDCPDHSTRGIE